MLNLNLAFLLIFSPYLSSEELHPMQMAPTTRGALKGSVYHL